MLWKAQETAAFLGVSTRTIYEMARTGGLPVVRVGRRVRFYADAIKAWAAAGGCLKGDRTVLPEAPRR